MSSEKLLGVDIGGTKIAVCLGTRDGEILDKIRFDTPEGWPAAVAAVGDALKTLAGRSGGFGTVGGVGISCGGPLDAQGGRILSPPNLPGWDDVPVTALLKERTGLPVFLENDANACALAEWYWGAGRGVDDLVFLTFGTGLGAGLILGGRLHRGVTGLAGEVGHIRLAESGPEGYGKAGSWEGFCSGGGISRMYRTASGKTAEAREVFQAAREGEPEARLVVETSARQLGRGIALLVDILNPRRIIIGSIFLRQEEVLRPLMEQEIFRESLAASAGDCLVVPAALGESLGDRAALGVAHWGLAETGAGGRPAGQGEA